MFLLCSMYIHFLSLRGILGGMFFIYLVSVSAFGFDSSVLVFLFVLRLFLFSVFGGYGMVFVFVKCFNFLCSFSCLLLFLCFFVFVFCVVFWGEGGMD